MQNIVFYTVGVAYKRDVGCATPDGVVAAGGFAISTDMNVLRTFLTLLF